MAVGTDAGHILSFTLIYFKVCGSPDVSTWRVKFNIRRSPQDGDSGHKNLIIIAPISLHKKWKFYIIVLPKGEQVGCRITDSLALNTKSPMTMFAMNWRTALMCSEIWWTMIMQIKILHNNFVCLIKWFWTRFHKYFQWSCWWQKYSAILYYLCHKFKNMLLYCWDENIIVWRAKLMKHLKLKVSWQTAPPITTGANTVANEVKHWRLRHNSNIFLKIKCFINMRKY